MTAPKNPHNKRARKKTGNLKGGKPPAGGGPDRVQTTRAERLFRLRVVEEAMIEGKRAAAVQEALAKVGRAVPARTVTDYIRAVRLKWEEEDKLHSGATRQRQLRDLYETARSMKAAKAWSAWVATQKLIADLEGNFPKDDGLPDGAGSEDFSGWSDEELDAYIESGGVKEPDWIKVAREAGSAPASEPEDTGGLPRPQDLLH